MNLATWPALADLIPPRETALRLRLPEPFQFGDRHRRGPGVLGIHDHRQTIVGKRQLDELDAGALTFRRLGCLDGPRRIRHIRLTAAELLEAAAGARGADGHAGSAIGALEFFGD